MKKKQIILLSLLCLLCLASFKISKNYSSDIFITLGIDSGEKDFVLSNIFCVGDPTCILAPPKMFNLKQIAVLASTDKLKIANEAFEYAKEYCNSPEFKTRYEEKRMSLKPRLQQLSESEKEMQRELIAQQEEMYTPEILDMLPEDARKTALQELENMKAIVDGELTDEQKRKWEDEAPANPDTAIKRALKEFLDATEHVDFYATTKLNPKNNHQVFINPLYEQKDNQWKACYRSGKELTDASRSFAKEWMAELD